MNEEQLRALFEQTSPADTPDPSAKRRAIHAALSEFDTAKQENLKKNPGFFQGILQKLRLTGMYKQPEDKTMRKVSQPWALGGMATAVVAVFGVLLVNYQPNHVGEDDSSMPELVLNLPAPPKVSPQRSEEVIVSGVRANIEDSLDLKRESVDSIVAEDIGAVPEMALAEAAASAEADMDMAKVASAPMKSKLARMESPRQAVRLQALSAPAISQGAYTSDIVLPKPQGEHRDKFESVKINPITRVEDTPVSTFSIDVDTASYSFVRSALNDARLPPKDAVRIEEMVNYFDYTYPQPATREKPFATSVSVIDSPWARGKKLMHIGIKGYDVAASEQPRSNLVFLLDVSGSMDQPNKLPLVKQSMHMLLSKLQPEDTVAIVVYAGAAGTVLEPTKVKDKNKIIAALSRLNAGGSTAGAEGIELAYQLAEANFDKSAVNRIILATDGDFNVGITSDSELKGYIERKRDKGIFLSVLGFGRGNYNDQLMQQLAQNGNGVAAYIDSVNEAQKVLVNEATSTLFPIAKDVKIQVEFNPAAVSEYRLIGYETRALKREDFNNDKVDAGDIGAGHTVTAIYEFTPAGSGKDSVDALRYQKKTSNPNPNSEYAYLKLRYKLPNEDQSHLLTTPVAAENTLFAASSVLQREVDFSVAVAGFAQLLKDDRYLGDWGYDSALALAQANRGDDPFGYRAEFVQLIRKAQIAKEM